MVSGSRECVKPVSVAADKHDNDTDDADKLSIAIITLKPETHADIYTIITVCSQ